MHTAYVILFVPQRMHSMADDILQYRSQKFPRREEATSKHDVDGIRHEHGLKIPQLILQKHDVR